MTLEEKIKEINRLIRLVSKTKQISESDFDSAIENIYKKSIAENSCLAFAKWLQLNCFLDRENDEWLLAEGNQIPYKAEELINLFKKEK